MTILTREHNFAKVMIVSGDRESEVNYLARKVGIDLIHAGKSPEEKIDIVRQETRQAKTVFLGDGINDAPALTAATVGIAFGQNSDITAEAAGAVIMESSLAKVDELMHISRRMRAIALQSAVGGMLLSVVGMIMRRLGICPRLPAPSRRRSSTSLLLRTPCARPSRPKILRIFERGMWNVQ